MKDILKALGAAVWSAIKPQLAPLAKSIGAAIIGCVAALSLTGCASPYQTPGSKTQTSSVYAFGLPAVVITHDNKQVADNSGDDKNTALTEIKR